MLFVVCLVSFVVHVFSMGYMKGDAKYPLFFAWLQMFSVAMLLLVLADNLLLLFVGWELVGLCSYKLIGFWSEKQAPGERGAQGVHHDAHRRPRHGARPDGRSPPRAIGFDYERSARGRRRPDGPAPLWLIVAGFGMLAAAAGKSAQVPFHVWLPDAMEGPTPVSRPDPRRHDGRGRRLPARPHDVHAAGRGART